MSIFFPECHEQNSHHHCAVCCHESMSHVLGAEGPHSQRFLDLYSIFVCFILFPMYIFKEVEKLFISNNKYRLVNIMATYKTRVEQVEHSIKSQVVQKTQELIKQIENAVC